MTQNVVGTNNCFLISTAKVVSQMAKPREHVNVPFLTKMIVLVGNLGLQNIINHYETPCSRETINIIILQKYMYIFLIV